ncbi:MAG: hypothetical protein KatS3mg044_0405 [Rhodothermaceae bacterium]|nr:MAG: hypothetical protein KatS3mg044_0405 [Rhodothermaceae bacterium]
MTARIYPAVPPALPPERRARIERTGAYRIAPGRSGVWIEAEVMIGSVRITAIRASCRAVVWPCRYGGEAAVVIEDEHLRHEIEVALRRLVEEEVERRRLTAGRGPA